MFKTLIDTDSLLAGLDNPGWRIFDTRYDLADKSAGKNAYTEGHIPGAIYVDVHDDLSGPSVTNRGRHPLPTDEAMQTLFSRLGITSETQVIVYDDSLGSFAARLWWMLQYMQHSNVAVLDGGWSAWVEKAGTVSTDAPIPAESEFIGEARQDDVIMIDQVEEFDCVIDSREPARYRGEIEPIDKAAGHIPGAVNRFWKNNLSPTGKFKDKSELRQEFDVLFNDERSEQSVFYCGSGVTACHNLLAVSHAGLPMPKLYAGSWSEWCNTDGKPIATDEQ